MELIWPDAAHLEGYAEALRRGWSANNLDPEAWRTELAQLEADPEAFLRAQVDREGAGPPFRLPDGTLAPRLPGYRRWLWDDGCCGSIGLRWQPGTPELPPHVLGHIGYAVVPWRRGEGHATRALALLLPDAAAEGLPWVTLTTDADNIASQRVVLANGGVLVGEEPRPAAYGGGLLHRYRIDLTHLRPG